MSKLLMVVILSLSCANPCFAQPEQLSGRPAAKKQPALTAISCGFTDLTTGEEFVPGTDTPAGSEQQVRTSPEWTFSSAPGGAVPSARTTLTIETRRCNKPSNCSHEQTAIGRQS